MEDDVPVVQGDWTKAINEATVWSGAVTVKGTFYVNAELTIKPGTVVTFREDAQLYVQNEGSIKDCVPSSLQSTVTVFNREKNFSILSI